jgi:hypothetical protein
VSRIRAFAKSGATGLRVVDVGTVVEVVGAGVVEGRVSVDELGFFESLHAPSRQATATATTNDLRIGGA